MTQDKDKNLWIPTLFYISAFYDGLLGLAFILLPQQVFAYFQVPPPNHLGYVQFPALLLIIFATMFYQIAREPFEKKELIIYGIMLKISYCTVTIFYWIQGTLPEMWRPFTICDALMGLLYILAYAKLAAKPAQPAGSPE
jgi:hypothetical protein